MRRAEELLLGLLIKIFVLLFPVCSTSLSLCMVAQTLRVPSASEIFSHLRAHISPIRKQLIRGKLKNIVEGRTGCDYPVRYAPRRRK